MNSTAARLFLKIAGVACLILFLAPSCSFLSDVDEGRRTEKTSITVGLESSPWAVWRRETKASGGFESEHGIRWASWSWLLLGAGVACLNLARRFPARSLGSQGAEDRSVEGNAVEGGGSGDHG